ncbi:MAG: class I SAM-dependent methyltransferase [Opitutaceae bacterium]|nr:class I SAM-dependent methyltransferase [Opitutaceae bacterium]
MTTAFPVPSFLIHLDAPTAYPLGEPFYIQGWVASSTPIRAVRVEGIDLGFGERPDVRAAHPDYPHITGFSGHAGFACLQGDTLRLTCELADRTESWARTLPRLEPPPDKIQRLQRIRPHLRSDLPCTETPFNFNFLTAGLRDKFRVTSTENVSGFEYYGVPCELIERFRDGLILDCGAGNRPRCFPNVINLEVVPYPSTDVLAVNEQLPFRDATFDALISCAVLEHLKDPFVAAREMVRVTKPGGLIHADVPFLQPYHGYPSHYYNMTSQGLVSLFQDSCEIQRAGVPDYGLPIWGLSWFLNSYLAGLPAATREEFANMRVADLLGHPNSYLHRPFVRELPAAKNLELACVTSVLAVKR